MTRQIDAGRLTAWYDFQAPIYHRWRDKYEGPLVGLALGGLGDAESLRVLDAGCGSGLMSIGIGMQRPGWQIEGVDLSNGLLAIGRREAAARGLSRVSFRQGSVEALAAEPGSFDAAVAAGLFPNLNEPDAALQEIHRVLRSGGRFVVVEFDRQSMDAWTRRFFRIMIAGQRALALFAPKFRFAPKWDVESSTIDEEDFHASLTRAGFSTVALQRREQHLIFTCRKATRP